MELDLVLLSRLQFAMSIMFHYIFPPLTIGLGILMVIVEGLWLKTGNPVYEKIAYFWTRLFAVNFALGVATGIVMEFEFGTNWATYSRFVGDVFGSALAAEGIFAFFLESGFLGVVIFGWNKVSPRFHFFSTCMVALGGFFSSVWIVIANSWMQTPSGYRLVTEDGRTRAEITDFWAMVFNPSAPDRLVHVWLGCFILGAFFVLSIASWYRLKGRFVDEANAMIKIALPFAVLSSSLMMVSAHSNGRMVANLQPAKMAAFESHFETGTGPTGMVLFGIPDPKTETVHLQIKVPYLLSFLVHGDLKTPVTGLDKFEKEDRPPILIPFFSYRIMIASGVFFLVLSWVAWLVLYLKKDLAYSPWLLRALVFSIIPAYAANQAGWVAAEVGRQPWIVYGLLRTKDGVSKSVPAEHVLVSMICFGIIYGLLFVVWVYVMNEKIQHGPFLPVSSKHHPDYVPPDASELTKIADSAAAKIDPEVNTLGRSDDGT